MIQKTIRQLIGTPFLWMIVFVLLMASAGCGTQQPSSVPTSAPTVPLPTKASPPASTEMLTSEPNLELEGRLIGLSDTSHGPGTLFEFTGSPGAAAQFSKIADQAIDAAVSPGKRYLLYATEVVYRTEGSTTLLDLQSGDSKTLFSSPLRCLSWSPDGMRFSYVTSLFDEQYGLYVSDLAGKSQRVYQPLSAKYGGSSTFYGSVGCAIWLTSDQLLFQGHMSGMPGSITIPGVEAQLKPDTTALIVLSGVPQVVESPKQWFVEDVSSNGAYVLLRDEEDGGNVYITPAFTDWNKIQPRPFTPCSDCPQWIRFTSNSKELYFVKEAEDQKKYVYFADAETLEVRRGPVFDDMANCPGGCRWLWLGTWVGDPANMVIAASVENAVVGNRMFSISNFVSVIDLNTGKVKVLQSGSPPGYTDNLIHARFLAWLAR